ncbi:ras GEF [Auriculariales sp. MPI-PUGE-AT-0066]|nr:ras GEF [Auriculariales sp. MPI-PUGE-AT-0066]
MTDSGLLHAAAGTLRKSISVDSFVNAKQAATRQSANASTRSSGGHVEASEDEFSADEDELEDYYGVTDAGDFTSYRRERGEHGDHGDEEDEDEEDEEVRRARTASNASSRYTSSGSSVQLPLPSRRRQLSPPPAVPPLPPHVVTASAPATAPATAPEFTIAVLGATGSGKTTLITHGLAHTTVPASTLAFAIGPGAGVGRVDVLSRMTTITLSSSRETKSDATVRAMHRDSIKVYEVNTAALTHHALGVWPDGMPNIDGVLICYDASNSASFEDVPALLRGFHALALPTVLLGCKSDLPLQVTPQRASQHSSHYGIGLIEVSLRSEKERKKMHQSFTWICKSIARSRRPELQMMDDGGFRNPASPIYLHSAPWSDRLPRRASRDQSLHPFAAAAASAAPNTQRSPLLAATRDGLPTPPTVGSPTRARNPYEPASQPKHLAHGQGGASERGAAAAHARGRRRGGCGPRRSQRISHDPNQSGTPATNPTAANPYLTLDELLDKLLFFAVSGDDATFISHFFLAFRRFASPRAVLLGMQKRLRALAAAPADVLLAKFAQMKICAVLEHWILNYPDDFATPGAPTALQALLKQLIMHVHTAHYGSELLPFLETIPRMRPRPNAWYKPIEDAPRADSDDEDGGAGTGAGDSDDDRGHSATTHPSSANGTTMAAGVATLVPPPQPRERASSFPVQSTSTTMGALTSAPATAPAAAPGLGRVATGSGPASGSAPALPLPQPLPTPPMPQSVVNIKDLQRVCGHFQLIEPMAVAQEITRTMLGLFLKIERDPETDPVRKFNVFYNYLVNWVASMILSSDKVAKRVKLVERFIELARVLRTQHNYSGLRCVVSGIRVAAPNDSEIMLLYKEKQGNAHKTLMSYVTLLSSGQSHRPYRTALKHTDGPAIPEMEITTSDLARANTGNQDFKEGDSTRVHWGKYALMGRLINNIVMFQNRCRTSPIMQVQDRLGLHQQLFPSNVVLMDDDMIAERAGETVNDYNGVPMASQMDLPYSNGTGTSRPVRSTARKLFFW